MSFDHVALHNVAELTPIDGVPGAHRLSRFPAALEPGYFKHAGRFVTRYSQGCEVRCVVPDHRVIFRVSSSGPARVHVYQGDYQLTSYELNGSVVDINVDVHERLLDLPEAIRKDNLFATNVIRLVVERGVVYLHAVDSFGSPCRAPQPDELPASRYLAYGSSITQTDTYGYCHQAARRLGADVLNKGMGGSCHVEKQTVDFLVDDCQWDFATLEWGINMRGTVEVEEFTRRILYGLDRFAATGKPIFIITIFRSDAHAGLGPAYVVQRQRDYDQVLRDACAQRAGEQPNVHLIEGQDVLANWTWLQADLVHPSHDGHNMMGENLANLIRPILAAS